MKYRIADKVKVIPKVASTMLMNPHSVYIVVKVKQIPGTEKSENFYCLRDDFNLQFCWILEEELIPVEI